MDVRGQTSTHRLRDEFGEWALNFANQFIFPARVKVTHRDKVDRALIRLYESSGRTDIFPAQPDKEFTVKGKQYPMNARQYTRYCEERGTAAYAAIKGVVSSERYAGMSDEDRADAIKDAISASNKQIDTQYKEMLGALD